MLNGVLPPLPTPFAADGSPDFGLLCDLVLSLNATPLAGYLVLGSNGEAVHLEVDEAVEAIGSVRAAAGPGRTVLAGTGQLGTRATIEMTRRAAGAGADAVLVLTPYYFKGAMTEEALRRHFEAVADASPVPVLLYNVPANTGLNMPPAVAAALAGHQNVAGMKDSAGDVGQLAELVRVTRGSGRFDVLSGNFGAALPGYAVGCVGAILAVANVAPGECAAIREAFLAGRLDEARELHLRLLPVARAVTTRFGVPGLKAALELLGRPAGVPRGPLLPLGEAARREVEATLRAAGLLG